MLKLTLIAFFFMGCCAPHVMSAQVSAPYSNDFSDSDSDFSTTNGQWTLDTPNGIYTNTIPANTTSSSTLQFGNLGSSQDFSLSSAFTITNSVSDNGTNSIGFVVLGSDADATTGVNPFYLADVYLGGQRSDMTTANAQLRLLLFGPNTFLTTMGDFGSPLSVNMDIPYTLTLDGTYNSLGDLTLDLTLSGNSATKSISATIPANDVLPNDGLTDQFFGFRNRATGGASSALTVEFDSFSVTAIPEPSSIGFVAVSLIGGYVVGRYMRRKIAIPSV